MTALPEPGAAAWAFTSYFGARDAELGEQAAVADLVTVLLDQPGWTRDALAAVVAALTRNLHRSGQDFYRIEQTLGRSLGHPPYGPEMFKDGVPNGDVCVGEHTPATLAAEAADRIRADTEAFDRIRLWLDAAHMAGPTLPTPTRGEQQLAEILGHIRGLVDGARPRPPGPATIARQTPIARQAVLQAALDTITFGHIRTLIEALDTMPTSGRPTPEAIAMATVIGMIRDLVIAARPDPHPREDPKV